MTTVSKIVSLFHTFSDDTNPSTNKSYTKKYGKRGSKALLLATNTINNNSLQKQIGISDEKCMLDKYETLIGEKICRRNEELLTYDMIINNKEIKIFGKIDGFIESKQIIIEHKRRTRGLLHRTPFHEIVQCYFYMKMMNSKITHLIETFGDHIDIHVIHFDDDIWDNICSRLNQSNLTQ